jgi:acyl-coenzyme A thioesterase PaaI-like protein
LTSELREASGSPLARFEFEPHNCFACGSLNANGLQLELHLEPGRSWTEFRLDRRFEGWEEIAHGGILCTILDEVMAWALVAEDNWGVTARMTVDFKKPVPVGTAIRADGWVTRSRRRVVDAAARIVDVGTGVELAAAVGTYVAADAAQKQRLRERYGFRLLRDAGLDTDPEPRADGRPRAAGDTRDAATPDTVDDDRGGGPAA